MTKEQIINDCLEICTDNHVDYPYGPAVQVVKNKIGKSFALVGILTITDVNSIIKNCDSDAPICEGDIFITLKCPPELINIFRDNYKAVIPGYYSNKNHWNTIILGKDCPYQEIKKMILQSFDLVTPKKK